MSKTITLENGNTIELPTGVELNGKTLRIVFPYEDKRRREPVKGPLTANTVKYAERLRTAVLHEIEVGTFDYATKFPNSKYLKRQAVQEQPDARKTMGDLCDEYERHIRNLDPKTVRDFKTTRKYLAQHFDESTLMASLSVVKVRGYVQGLEDGIKEPATGAYTRKPLSPKTVNTHIQSLRWILKQAANRGMCEGPLLDEVKTRTITQEYKDQAKEENNDAFTIDEVLALEQCEAKRPEVRDMLLFAIYTGLSISELHGLCWEDVDSSGEVWTAKIQRACSEGIMKSTKNAHRSRTVELSGRAKQLLRAQKLKTSSLPPITVPTQRKVNAVQETLMAEYRLVWRRPTTGQSSAGYWAKGSPARHIKKLCRDAGVRERAPNQGKHSFATLMFSARADLNVVARQLGHTDTKMLMDHYAKVTGDGKGLASQTFDAAMEKLRLN
ncbi:Arm DNA-binding domain-containing protein [Parahaliea mediterranea]|uniref:Arm DNA-binding domain-containing protein n=1 Tax=Parahaliea mediterranea TaxID=651086 RepID=UPI000E2FDA5B|nr:DUF3596 domain-containing protein [Parahaliea mediterranea]